MNVARAILAATVATSLALAFACGTAEVVGFTDEDGGTPDGSVEPTPDATAGNQDASAGNDSGTGPRDGDVDAYVNPNHSIDQTMLVQGIVRTYDITVPLDCVTTTTKVPLVVILHGDGQQGADMYQSFGLEAAATDAGAEGVFVYPNGTNDAGVAGSAWNLYDDPGTYPYPPMTPSGNNDVDYFDQMVTTFDALPCVDQRVFVTGISSGGYMSNQLARWRSGTVTGTAPMSGEAPTGTADTDYPINCIGATGPVPALIIHGTADMVLTPDNGEQTASYWDIANLCTDAADDCVASADGGQLVLAAPPGTPTTPTTPSPCVSSNGCTAAPVTFCLVDGLAHQIWDQAGTVIWSFIATTQPDAGP